MKINWKVLVALVVIVGAAFWMVDSVRTRSYSGRNLTFVTGRGPITVNNLSDHAVPAQLTGVGSRTFSVSSNVEGLSGTSAKPETGNTNSQLLALELPPGISEFTVTRGSSSSSATSDVTFLATTDSELSVNAQPLSSTDARTTVIVGLIIIVGGLFYISHTTQHAWFNRLRGKQALTPAAVPVETTAGSQGNPMRAYGDNRADITSKPS